MTKEQIVEEMIAYIEETEKEFQAASFVRDGTVQKNKIVNSILAELEKKVSNENTQD